MTHYTADGAGKRRPLPSYNILRESLAIDDKSPSGLRWLKGKKKGKPAGSLRKDGFYVVSLEGTLYAAARIIASLALCEVVQQHQTVLFVDGDRSNNRPENLKVVNTRSLVEEDEETDPLKDGIIGKTINGIQLHEVRIGNGYLMGRFYSFEVACDCYKTAYEQVDTEGDLAKQLSLISKRHLSDDASRLHRATNQY